MLELKVVNTFYDKSHILHDVSMCVRDKEIVVILGRNGVGKTTTVKTIMGLTPPKSGSIIFKGEEIAGLKPFQVARLGIGFVPEERWIFPKLTVHQNLLIGMKKEKDFVQSWTFEKCYEYFPALQTRQNAKGRTLSGGERQMLTIARTLMGNPELILIDEPTEGLAPKIIEVIDEIIRRINNEGRTILLIEQKLALALSLANRVYVMSKGMMKWEGPPEDLSQQDDVRKQYLEV
jgi:branched-chain amino acid transport system ATP-binding protein